jgi:hypothetical protein
MVSDFLGYLGAWVFRHFMGLGVYPHSILHHPRPQEEPIHRAAGGHGDGGGGADGVGRNGHGGASARAVDPVASVPVPEVGRPLVVTGQVAGRIGILRVGEGGDEAIRGGSC